MSEEGIRIVDPGHVPASFPPVSRRDDGPIPPPRTKAEKAEAEREFRETVGDEREEPAVVGGEQMLHVDFLCGCGGWTAGMQQAGYKTVLAIDSDPLAIETHALNFPETAHINRRLQDIAPPELERFGLVRGMDNLCFSISPPCQQWSTARSKTAAPRKDGNLTLDFLPFVDYWMPRVLLMENVRQYAALKNVEASGLADMRRLLAAKSYSVEEKVLNCADYGVPQHRIRWMMIALRNWLREDPVKVVRDEKSGMVMYLVGDSGKKTRKRKARKRK